MALAIDGVYDIETENWTTFVCGGLLTVGGDYEFYDYNDEDKFFEAILNTDGNVFAHNGGKFDHLWFINEAAKRSLKMKLFIASGSIIRAEFPGYKLKLCDSWRIFMMSLKDLTNGAKLDTGLPCVCGRACGGYCSIKRDMPPEHWAKIKAYQEQDCRGLLSALEYFTSFAEVNEIDIGLTIGGTAWRTVRNALNLDKQRLDKHDFKFTRSGYYGGRCQLFQREAAKGYQYDVNSMYPAMLASQPVPVGEAFRLNGFKEARTAYAERRPGVYGARVNVPYMHIPPLPVRAKTRICYPWGDIEGVWALPELLYAESLGCEVKVCEGIYWSDEQVVFKDWVERMFDLRTRYGKKTREGKWIKGIINSLTGKFGSNPEKEHIIFDPDNQITVCECESDAEHEQAGPMCRAMRPLRPDLPVYIKPMWHIDDCAHAVWAAYLTSNARITLHKQLCSGPSGGLDALYCDTDSVFSVNARTVAIGDKLGQWAPEGEFTDFYGLAPKAYRYNRGGKPTVKAKGIPYKAILGREDEAWKEMVSGTPMVSEQMLGLKQVLRHGHKSDDPSLFKRGKLTRQLTGGFGDRVADGDNDTRPPHISEVTDG